jgi:UDP-glucose 4-epimerase
MEVNGKNVLITGGAGFIGSHLTEEYLANNAGRVIVYDDFSTGNLENLNHIKDERLKLSEGLFLIVLNLMRLLKRRK